MAVKILLVVLFFGIMVTIGILSRGRAKSVNDFVLGGRTIGPWLTAFAYGTSYFSAVVFIGYAGQFGWKYGISAVWIGLGNAVLGSLMAWVVLGRRTRVMTKHLEAATMPDFFGKRYGSSALKIAASAIVFIFLIPYTASVYNGLSRLFSMAFDIPYVWCIVGMAVLTGIYVIVGGYMATAINDFIQGIIMLGGIVAVIASVLGNLGGFTNALTELSKIPSDIPAAAGQQGSLISFFGPDPLNLLGVVVLTSLGTWGLPQMVHKFYTIKSEHSIRVGTVISTLFAVIIAGGSYFLGGLGRLFGGTDIYAADGSVMFDSIVPEMLRTSLSDLLIGIVVVLVLSASMSTLSSLVLTSSSTLTLDFIDGVIVKKMSGKAKLLTMRILIAFFIALSVFVAVNKPPFIAQLMGISWGALAGAFLAPFLYGLFWKRATRAAVWFSFVSGVGITVSNLFFKFIASPINAGAITMLVGLAIVPIVSLLSPKPDPVHVESVFSCYKEKVAVSHGEALAETEK